MPVKRPDGNTEKTDVRLRSPGGDAGWKGEAGSLQQMGGIRSARAAEARRNECGSRRGLRTKPRSLQRREGPAEETEPEGPVTRGKKREAVTSWK